jgi:hypothetical protein
MSWEHNAPTLHATHPPTESGVHVHNYGLASSLEDTCHKIHHT